MPSVGVLLLVSVLCLPVALVNGVSIFPTDQLVIREGAGFLVHLISDQLGDPVRWIHCSVTVGGASYSLDSDQIHVINGLTKVQRFGVDACGIRVQNVRKSLDLWTLSALDSDSKSFEKQLKVEVSIPKQISTLNVTISDTVRSYTVTCPEDSSRRFCRIMDEADGIYDGCSKSFEITWKTAQFRCRMLYWGDMDETETVINVLVEKSKRDVTWSIEENDSHVVLTCHYRSKVSPCRAVSLASRRQMMLLDAHLADRYSAYNTKVSLGICALEIKKPLLKEDYGIWRIYLPLSASEYTGCVFNVESQHDELADENDLLVPPPTKLIEVFHDPRSASTTMTELSCETSHPIDYCYLTGPQGGNYAPDSFDRLKTLGFCQFQVSNITSGLWACGFNDANGGEDRMSYFDVKVYGQPGKAIPSQIKASKGDESKRMLCKTILELPIEICRFVSPSGGVHGLSENVVPGDGSRFRYYGEGLRAGECGMEITEVEREDFGWWTCAIKVQGKDYTIGMELIEEGEL
ncbi:uncharacterized protein LOC135705317 isoform X2 [Ochlerotatus camptorhynchus]|uniref:uncharacterized protein LOC135705317 isoform X2 n=1 Tax=Ochlerotatus camptorhynchus TaxID=644619 RepID=UPI0031DE5D01